MSASSRGWSSLSAPRNRAPRNRGAGGRTAASADRWIWGVWVAAALLAVVILPFATRLDGVARAIARFCGFGV